MYETAVNPTHLWTYSKSAEKKLDPVITSLHGRLITSKANTIARSQQQPAPSHRRPSRSRSTFISSTPSKLREMVYRNKRSRASSTGGHHHTPEPPSLPDRLANALKSLKPALLAHSSSSSSASRNKSAVVDADDVLYFPNVGERHWGGRNQGTSSNGNSYPKQSHSMDRNEVVESSSRSRDLQFHRQHRPTQKKSYDNSQPVRNLQTLDDIRQLYTSVPNFESLENGSDTEKNNLYSTRRISESITQPSEKFADDLGHQNTHHTHNRLVDSEKAQLVNNGSPSLSPRSLNAMSASISSSSNSSTRSAADSGYRSHRRPNNTQQTENLNESLLKAKSDCSKNGSPSSENMRSIVYVDPNLEEASQFGNRKISVHHQPTVLHVSKTIIASGTGSFPDKGLDTQSQSTWVNLPMNCPDRYNSIFSYTVRDLKAVIDFSNITLNNHSYSVLLKLFRSTLDQFCLELQRLVCPFVKCTKKDLNMTLMMFLDEKTAYKCIDCAVQALNSYSTNATLSMSLENRAALKLNVGKMLRFLNQSRYVKIAFDSTAVYLTAIMEKLLLLYVQSVERTEGPRSWSDTFQQHKSLFSVFTKFEESAGTCCVKSRKILNDLLVPSIGGESKDAWQHKWAQNYELGLRFSESAKHSLFYYTRCSSDICGCAQRKPSFADWMTKLMALAEHRNTVCLGSFDILEVARCLLSTDLPPYPIEQFVDTIDCADWKILDIAYLWEGESKRPDLRSQLSHCDPNRTNAHGLACISRCILCSNDVAVETMLNQNCNIDLPVAPSNIKGLQRNCKMLEFLGWSPLIWSIATGNLNLTQKLICKKVKLNAGWMTCETPLQIAAAMSDDQIVRLLINEAVDLFFTSVRYDESREDRSGVPSALAIAASLGRNRVFDMLLDEYRSLGSTLKHPIPASIADLLKNESASSTTPTKMDCCTQTINYEVFSKAAQCSLREALYYSLECGNLDVAYDLSCFGVKWNVNMWVRCLHWSLEQKSGLGVKLFADTFRVNQLIDAPIFLLEDFCNALFEAVEVSLTQSFIDENIRSSLLSKISSVFKHFNSPENENKLRIDQTLANSKSSNGVVIDPKYCDNEKFSDIQFVLEDKKIFAHRIVISAYPKFEAALQNSHNIIKIEDTTYNVFKAVIEFVYGKHNDCMRRISDLAIQDQLKAIDTSMQFGLDELSKRIIDAIDIHINCTTCIPVFVYAFNSHNDSLMQIAEPFILRNLETLSNEQRDVVANLNEKYRLFGRLADYLNKCFRLAYERPSTLQYFSVQKL